MIEKASVLDCQPVLQTALEEQRDADHQHYMREFVKWLEKNKEYKYKSYGDSFVGTPESTGGIINLSETYWLIPETKIEVLKREGGL